MGCVPFSAGVRIMFCTAISRLALETTVSHAKNAIGLFSKEKIISSK
jgi:hypothetical protein